MRRILIGLALVLVALPAPAWAQTRDENVARCVSAPDPASPDLKIGACTALLQSGQEAANNIPIIYYDRGNGYRKEGLYDQAIADYSQAIALNPNYANAYNNRGIAYEYKNQRDQAIADYRMALKIDPNHQSSLSALKRLGVTP
jgi:tetratricopeptide (TPR) repeat protein